MDLTPFLRDVPDFPVPGVLYKDITPLVADPAAFRYAVDALAERIAPWKPDRLCAAEARGFLFAAALGYKMNLGSVLVRKPGKLPWKTISARYELEYGVNELFMHEDAVRAGERVVLLDDLLATGGTAKAMVELCERLGAAVAGLAFVVELVPLRGRDALAPKPVEALVRVDA